MMFFFFFVHLMADWF